VHLVGRICSAITDYWEEGEDMATSASEHGWPLIIDFEKIPQQIMNLKERIEVHYLLGDFFEVDNEKIELIFNNFFVLKDVLAWKTFLTLLEGENCNMGDFHGMQEWSKFRAVGTNSHAG